MVKQRVITRNRAIKSCKYCYHHKLKCDRGKPCSVCSACDRVDQCVYGFAKRSLPTADATEDRSIAKKPLTKASQHIKKVSKNSVVYKSKYSYPFFTSSINDKILSAGQFDKKGFSKALTRNELHNFNRTLSPAQSLEEVLAQLPLSKTSALSHVETYFERIHPILPFYNQEKVRNAFTDVYESVEMRTAVDLGHLLVVMAIFFCASYAAVASGTIPDLLLCNNYYKSIRYLLDLLEFPFKPLLESLQAFTVVNFVIDPNMVDASAYSPMLVRMGQELGLHKGLTPNTVENRLMWNLLLYIEGSSSVVRGFPFLTAASVMNEVPLPELAADFNCSYPVSFTIGRCKINNVFREVMGLTSLETITSEKLRSVEGVIKHLYQEISAISVSLHKNHPSYAAYYSSTLYVFVYRLHLRYYALSCLMSEEDKLLQKTNVVISSDAPIDIANILSLKQSIRKEVVELSVMLLFHTYKRLVQQDIDKFVWYTRGSTVMQYLFVLIKNISQSPNQSFGLQDVPTTLHQTLDEEMIEIILKNPVLCKYALVEGVLALLELKLAPLWNNEDLYKLLLVKKLKEQVWNSNDGVLRGSKGALESLQKYKLFSVGVEQLQNVKSINFEECLEGWDSDDFSLNMDRILTSWMADSPNS